MGTAVMSTLRSVLWGPIFPAFDTRWLSLVGYALVIPVLSGELELALACTYHGIIRPETVWTETACFTSGLWVSLRAVVGTKEGWFKALAIPPIFFHSLFVGGSIYQIWKFWD
jgi:hypothetical protein